MSPIKAELLKTIETAPNSAIEQTLCYLSRLLPDQKGPTNDFQPKTTTGKTLEDSSASDRQWDDITHGT